MKRVCQTTLNKLSQISQHTTTQLFSGWSRLQDGSHSYYSLYSELLQMCIRRKSVKEGRLVHNHLITNGFHSDSILNTKLIILYSKLDDMVSARKLFDRMPERSVVTWTAMLSGYSQTGCPEEALSIFAAMHRLGVKANQFTYGSSLRACTSMVCLHSGLQIQGCIYKSRLVNNLFVQSALVDLHCKCGRVEDACFIFESMAEKDVVSWNTMLGGYAVRGISNEAFQLFRSMLIGGVRPDCFTLSSVMKASAGGSGLKKVSQVHKIAVQLGFESSNLLTGSMIDAYAKCGGVRIANQIYKKMQKKDIISCTALISGYARAGIYTTDVLNLFTEMHRIHIRLDKVILCLMLNVCAKAALMDLGRQIHALALKSHPKHDTPMGNALIDMYSKSGDIEYARHAFNRMEQKNVISWTSLIDGYGKHGHGHESLALYKRMECEGLKPNDVTFLSLLFACSHAGLTNEGFECFNNMVKDHGIVPRDVHFCCVVDLYARAGNFGEAIGLIRKMNIKPTSSLWGSLLGACYIYGNVSLGVVAANHLFHMEPEKSVNYVVLASAYAAFGLWDSVLKTRKSMDDRSLRKDPGYSLFQSTKSIHFLPC